MTDWTLPLVVVVLIIGVIWGLYALLRGRNHNGKG